jgi:hypothetical protein
MIKIKLNKLVSYQISRNGSIIGTFSHLEVSKGLMDGTFLPTDHYWSAGMAGWKALGEFKVNQPIQSNTPQPAVSVNNTVSTKTKIIKVLWVLFALFMPYFGAWRIIFDKSLGFSKAVKIGFTIHLTFVIGVVFYGIKSGQDIAPANSESARSQSDSIEFEVRQANALINSESIDDRRKAFIVIKNYATIGRIDSQCRMGDIYQGGLIDGNPNLIEAYAWYTITATTHTKGIRKVEDNYDSGADAEDFDGTKFTGEAYAKKFAKLQAHYHAGYSVPTLDGHDDEAGLGNYINTANSSLSEITKRMSPAQIEEGNKRVKEITK